jgi:hypothetical protein
MLCGLAFLCVFAGNLCAGQGEWLNLSEVPDWAAWKQPTGDWQTVGSVRPDPENPKRLTSTPGTDVIVNGPTGRTRNLVTKQNFGDIEAHLEFMVPKSSNSGVKFQGLYEIQILDSWGVKTPKASDCGGIYPRAELLPKYHYLDKGYPPRVNACRPPGEWQTLDVLFKAPRFDAEGKKVASARFQKIVLNGQVIHQDLEVSTPTGHAWKKKEVAQGPLLLQADHGPVAFRNIRVRALSEGGPRSQGKRAGLD